VGLDLSEFLGRLVFPALIVALAALSVAAQRIFQKQVARIPVALTGLAVLAYLAFEVAPRLRERYFGPVSVRSEPATFFGVGADGQPTPVELKVFRGEALVSSTTFEPAKNPLPVATASDRPLRLEPVPGYGFRVLSEDAPLGLLTLDAVSGAGLVAALPSAPSAPLMFVTQRVTAGTTAKLGDLGPSQLNLRFLGMNDDGHARVTLESPELGAPTPQVLEIPHKDVRLQRFDGGMTFFVALPTADFRGPTAWAQFTVISASRPPIAALASKPGSGGSAAAPKPIGPQLPDVASGPPKPKVPAAKRAANATPPPVEPKATTRAGPL
jgi:hypothetical protein